MMAAPIIAKGVPPPAPADFDETFVRVGRLACEEHYRAARIIIDAWLRERGKQRLIDERAKFVEVKEAERHTRSRLTRRDMGRVLDAAFPVKPGRFVNPAVAQRAAHHLRIVRNGGWIVSPIGGGLWRLGLRVVTAAELVEIAKVAGFSANLPGGE